MAAKIQILDKQINSFGGIFYVISQFRSSGQAALIDKTLGVKGINTKFSYSNVVENLTSIFVSGGEVLEDVNFFRQEAFKANPDYRSCSADTIGRDLRGLAVENTGSRRFIETEKYDATYSYKKANGYFPGIAQINLHPFYIENRDGNANVKFEQAETLERAFAHLKANDIKVDKARMDCGSYSQEVVEFYNQRGSSERIFDMQNNDFGWKHLPFSFMKENTVFMIFTALIRNFYVWLLGKIAATARP